MEPTVYIGDLVLVNKLAYDLKVPFSTVHLSKWSDPKRGEIVFFYKPGDKQRVIKRVIVSWDKEDYYKPRFERFLQKLI